MCTSLKDRAKCVGMWLNYIRLTFFCILFCSNLLLQSGSISYRTCENQIPVSEWQFGRDTYRKEPTAIYPPFHYTICLKNNNFLWKMVKKSQKWSHIGLAPGPFIWTDQLICLSWPNPDETSWKNFILQPKAAIVHCGHRPQHLRSLREAICS